MRVNKSVLFGLVSLVYTVNATQATMGQSPITVTSNGCTAICEMTEEGGKSCQAFCGGSVPTSHPTTPAPTSTSTVMTTVTSRTESLMTSEDSGDDCNAFCEMTEEGLDCELLWFGTDHDCNAVCSISDELDFECEPISSSTFFISQRPPNPTGDARAALKQRGVTITNGDCTALCWDLMPGTECDVQCSSEFKTEMPVPSKAVSVTNLEARENLLVRQVREARLARKFGGNVARDDNQEMTSVTITSTPATITSTQIASTTAFATEILSMSEATAATVPGSATAELAAAASSLLAQVITFSKTATIDETLLPSMVHSAPASRKTFSSVLPLPIFTNATIAAPASTGFAPTVTPTRTFNVSRAMVSASKAPTYNSSKTTTASATTTEALVVSQAGTPAGNYNTYSITTTFNGAPQYTGSSGLVWSLLVGLAANVAFLI